MRISVCSWSTTQDDADRAADAILAAARGEAAPVPRAAASRPRHDATPRLQVAILLFDGVTALDAVGPFEVLSRLPGAEVRFVGARPGIVETARGPLGLRVTHALTEARSPQVVLVPGGPGARGIAQDERVLAWLRAVHETSTWTASVCTGSLVLGAAGLLRGVRATTHWMAMDDLAAFGAVAVRERVLFDGKIATGAGVSAGIDLALTLAARLAGPGAAREIQLVLEYAPEPPFDAGSPDAAAAEVVARLRAARARES
jgi:transcriptional regulator GlxA family with amidase domain